MALLRNPCVLGDPQKRGQIRSGYVTLAFSGAKKSPELLRDQKWLHQPCLLKGQEVGGSAR